jgi:hypothetical protein
LTRSAVKSTKSRRTISPQIGLILPAWKAMKKVLLFSLLLIVGMIGSQILPTLLGDAYHQTGHAIQLLTMIALAFIMIQVGFEFDIDKTRLGEYGWDYIVAMTAAAFPWLLVCAYFVFVLLPGDAWNSSLAWKESLLASRFAAPTSAGVLFSMLIAAGLGGTWVFRKARVLAIFDDLDTVLLMIPLKMLMVGMAWQLGVVVLFMGGLLWLAWRYLHRWKIPASWPWVLGYAAVIGVLSELVYNLSKTIDDTAPVHIEVLLPAFVLGCVMAHSSHDSHEGGEESAGNRSEQRAATVVSAVFMVLVGLSMPAMFGEVPAAASASGRLSAAQPMPGWGLLLLHVGLLTILANLGKMFPAFCYRRQATRRTRLGLAIGLWPRGEVGAGVLVASMGYGLGGPMITSAMLCLALNLVLTGAFVAIVRKLIEE